MEYGVRSTRAVSRTPLDKRNGMGWERGLVSQLLVFFFFSPFYYFFCCILMCHEVIHIHGCMAVC